MDGRLHRAASTPEKLQGTLEDEVAWVHFAHTANPDVLGLPHWPAYDPNTRATLLFDVPCRVENDPRKEERLVGKGVPASRIL